MRHQISKKERAALTIAGAQRLAGLGATPTARQVRKAHDEAGCAVAKQGVVVKGGADSTDGLVNKICGKLSGIGGETSTECGSFWSKIKDTVVAMVPFAGLASSAATVTMAVKQMQGGRPAPAAAPAAPAAPAAQPTDGGDGSTQSVSGYMLHPEKNYAYLFGDELDGEEVYGSDELGAYVTIEGGDFAGDDALGAEDVMYASEAGGAEMDAIERMHGWHQARYSHHQPQQPRPPAPATEAGGTIPHVAYRALILKQAKRAGGNNPSAKQMAQAQSTIDKLMAGKGVSVSIPGAKPGRVTR